MQVIAVVVVFNPQGLLLVHRRSPLKREYPGMLGLGAGGKVELGEDPRSAAARELEEELAISLSSDQLELVGSLDFKDEELQHQIIIFKTVTSAGFQIGAEFSEAFWVEQACFQKLCETNAVCPDTALYFKEFF